MISLTVRFHGVLRGLCGVASVQLPVEDCATLARVLAALAARHPILIPVISEVTVNRAGLVVERTEALRDGDLIDLAPKNTVA